MTPSPVLKRVTRGGLCSGCGACAAVVPGVISMKLAEPGYLRPVQSGPVSREQDRQIAAICPGLGIRLEPAGRHDHPLWGPFVSLRRGHATDPELRHRASSGGALSAILVHLLETGAVGGVVQTAAAPDLPIGNTTVLSTTARDVSAAAGSRYAPSAPLEGLQRHLDGNRRMAFVGKPCDVAALRGMERTDPRVSRCFPVMVSFFCAGIPSLSGARRILDALGVAERDVAAFRYRGHGWPGQATAALHDGGSRQMSYAESWGGILSKHVQFRCRICPDGTGGLADIVCADAWETDGRGYPLFEERDGLSLLIGRTGRGEDIIRDAMAAGRIAAAPFPAAGIRDIQPGQRDRKRFALPRILALRLMARPAPEFRGFHLVRNALSAGLWPLVRNFLGTCRRIVAGKI